MKRGIGTFVALVATASIVSFAGATPARAQYTNPYTGNTWNNPNSSLIDTMLLNQRNAMMMRNMSNSGNLSSSMTAARSRMMHAGALKIKRGEATTKFALQTPFDRETWITRCGAKTPEMRRQYAEELETQREIWAQEIQQRGADRGDMAAMLGIGFVLAWEAHSGGQKATPAQYRWIANDFRRALMKDSLFQGMSVREKQDLYEQQMVSATDAIRLWRRGQTTSSAADQKAGRESASRYLQRWWDEPVERLVATSTGFASRPKGAQ